MATPDTPKDQASPGHSLNSAISDFTSSFIKTELRNLVSKHDDTLSRNHVPRLRALLREVDKERDAFDADKARLLQGLQDKLERLDVEAAIIDHSLDDLRPMAPVYLGVIPAASTLTIRPPTPHMSPARPNNYLSTVLSPDEQTFNPGKPARSSVLNAPSPFETAQSSVLNAPSPFEPAKSSVPTASSPFEPPPSASIDVIVSPKVAITDRQVQPQVVAKGFATSSTTKRPRTSGDDDGGSARKRQKSGGATESQGGARSGVSRKMAFPNMETGECIFRHSKKKGFFVIRCDRNDCSSGYFKEPPLTYNRALKHFQAHGELGPDGEDLTNEYIFDKYAVEIEGVELVSKYWVKEHLGPRPHQYIPGRATKRNRSRSKDGAQDDGEDDLEDGVEEDAEDETDKARVPSKIITLSVKTPGFVPINSTTGPKAAPIDSINGLKAEAENDGPRRLRRVPRPDYAELVANKDPWGLSEPEEDEDDTTTTRSSKRSRATASSRRKSGNADSTASPSTSKTSTPGPIAANKANPSEPPKPFGYTSSQQWPRRSAPR